MIEHITLSSKYRIKSIQCCISNYGRGKRGFLIKTLLCFSGNDIETSTHYLFHCSIYANKRMTLLDKIKRINCGILELSDAVVTKILLFRDNTLSAFSDTLILNSTINYVIYTRSYLLEDLMTTYYHG